MNVIQCHVIVESYSIYAQRIEVLEFEYRQLWIQTMSLIFRSFTTKSSNFSPQLRGFQSRRYVFRLWCVMHTSIIIAWEKRNVFQVDENKFDFNVHIYVAMVNIYFNADTQSQANQFLFHLIHQLGVAS